MVPQKANKQTHRHTNTQTDKHMDKLTYSIGPDVRCFENVIQNSVIKKIQTFKMENNKFELKKNM